MVNEKKERLFYPFLLVAIFLCQSHFAFAVSSETPSISTDSMPQATGSIESADAFVLPLISKETEELGGQRFRIGEITFNGNTVFSTSELDALAKPYMHRSIGALEIEELRQLLTRKYVDSGFVSSGAILTHPVVAETSILNFNIVEGRVSEVRIAGLGDLKERYVVERLLPDPNAALNIEKLRARYELLLSDPLFSSLSTRLVPGNDQGSSLLYVDVSRALPYQVSIFTNNYSAPSIGENAMGVSGLVRNLTGYGDTFNYNFQGPRNNFKLSKQGINWTMPINGSGTQINLTVDDGASSVVESSVASLDIHSTLSSREFGISQTFINTQSLNLTYGLARSKRSNETSLLGVPFSFSSGIPDGVLQESAWKVWQDFSWRTESTVLAARVTRNQIENNLVPNLLDTLGTQPPNHYSYWITQLSLGHRLTESGAQLQLRATFQNTSKHLTSLDRFGIGGAMTVRGYRENQLLRDVGTIINIETDIPVLNETAGEGHKLGVTPFYAWGRAKNVGETGDILSSWGVAMRSEWRNWVASLALAKRMIRTPSIDVLSGSLQDKGIHFQLIYNFQRPRSLN